MIANLPTDSIAKFTFFAGVILMVTGYIDSRKISSQLATDRRALIAYNEDVIKQKSIQIQYYDKVIAELDKEIGELRSNPEKYIKPSVSDKAQTPEEWRREALEQLRSRDSLETSVAHDELYYKVENLSHDLTMAYYLMFIGLFLTGIGYMEWKALDRKINDINEIRTKIVKRRYLICQSCGTELQFKNIRNAEIYCSFCHNGYSFVNPDMSYKDMKAEVRKKMMSDGFADDSINEHINKLPKLYRWRRIFKWEKADFPKKTGELDT